MRECQAVSVEAAKHCDNGHVDEVGHEGEARQGDEATPREKTVDETCNCECVLEIYFFKYTLSQNSF